MIKLLCAMLYVIILLPVLSFADETINGHYCYTYGDSESLKEAREVTKTLAIRNAIESYRIFVESTTKISNFALTNDIVQMLSAGYLKDITLVKHDEQGRTICDTIKATVKPSDIETFVKREVKKRNKDAEDVPVDSNDCLKILSAKRAWCKSYGDPDYPCVTVVVKALIKEEDCQPFESQLIYVDYVDANGSPINGDSRMSGLRRLSRGEINAITFDNHKLPNDGTFRVWLQK